MPGEHIDRIVNKASEELLFKPLPQEEVNRLGKEERERYNKLTKSDHGGTVFKEIEDNKDLTPQEKQEIHQRLGKICMADELNKPQENTILRNATKGTNYISSYLKVYAKDYNEAVVNHTKQELAKLQMPEDEGLAKRFPRVGEKPEGSSVTPETLKKLDDMHLKFANEMARAHDENLHKLSPEAKAFLQSTMEPVAELDRLSMTGLTMSSTLVLKNTNPIISDMAQKMGQQPGSEGYKGKFLMESSKVLQSYTNSIHLEPGAKLDPSKTQNVVAEKLLTRQNLDRTREAYNAVSRGGPELDKLNAKLATIESVKPDLNKIAKLEQQLDRLKTKPTTFDKFKAVFQGGMEKAQQKVLDEIDKTKMKVFQKTDPEGFAKLQEQNKATVEGMKNERREFAGQKVDHMKATMQLNEAQADLIKDQSLKSSNLPGLDQEELAGTQLKKEQAQDQIKLSEKGAQKYDELDSEVKALEKNVSVREKLGNTIGQKPEGTKQGIKMN